MFRSRSIFANRWMTLVWAAGILLFAYQFAGGDSSSDDPNQVTDVTGAPVDAQQMKDLQNSIDAM